MRGNITASAAIKQNDREKKRGPAAGTKRFKSARARVHFGRYVGETGLLL